MEVLQDYTVKSKQHNIIWLFKYHLNGDLKAFEILGDYLTPSQINWLFNPENFPYHNSVIETKWKGLKKNFEITKGEFDLSFQNFYNMYERKLSPREAEKAWNRLTKKDKINALIGIKHYNNYLKRNPGLAKAYPATYLNNRRWESDYRSM